MRDQLGCGQEIRALAPKHDALCDILFGSGRLSLAVYKCSRCDHNQMVWMALSGWLGKDARATWLECCPPDLRILLRTAHSRKVILTYTRTSLLAAPLCPTV